MINKDTLLQRVPELDLRVYSDNHIRINYQGSSCLVDYFGLKILDFFATPQRLDAALQELGEPARGAQDWIDLTQYIIRLYKVGILRDVSQPLAALRSDPQGFDAAFIHIMMLNDQPRTRTYLDAIAQVVKPGDVVVDIGTGSGVLAVAAAQAGARQVYAIEASSIGGFAEQVFARNGYSNQIKLISGWSTQVQLPELADLLISEIIGNDPFGERVLETTLDARKRFLKPGARMIPQGVTVKLLPLTAPNSARDAYLFSPQAAGRWHELYGIDFQPLAEIKSGLPFHYGINAFHARDWPRLSSPVEVITVDFFDLDSIVIQASVRCIALTAGELNAILVYFDLHLADGITLSTAPDAVDEQNSWSTLVWLLPEPLKLNKGQPFLVKYTYNAPGATDGVQVELI